jgi:tRNA-2-methylthio-N6-dimethylallyladenosine synthase
MLSYFMNELITGNLTLTKNKQKQNKVYIETFGCQMNVSDSERVATNLVKEGYQIVNSSYEADVVLLNTCSVRERAEHKLYTRVGEIAVEERAERPIVGVLGCVAQLEGESLFKKSPNIDFVVGTRAVGRVGSLIERTQIEKRRTTDLGEREDGYDWNVSIAQSHSPYVAFVPIIEGCNKFCTYCIVPFSRGREKSLPASQIIQQVISLRDRGVREVHLIGQNVNSYRPLTEEGMEKFSGATPFSRLLRAVASVGIERIKFNTSFPRDFHPDIVKAINEWENLCNWVHLPVQSGSDNILRAMRRGHTSDNYLKRINAVKNSKRDISLTTDIIVGFPGETEDDFERTLGLYERCRFDMAYIFKYSPREGTPSAALPESVSPQEKRERFLRLEAVQKRIQSESLQSYVGRTVDVLAERFSAKSEKELTGHSTCHKVVNFVAEPERLGQVVKVKITEHKVNSLRGKIVSDKHYCLDS